MTIAKAGEAWESSQQHEFYSHEAKKGVRKLRPSRRTRFRKLPAATRFPTMQLVLPRWWLRRCTTTHRSPERWPPDIGADDGLLENFPGSWGFIITPHNTDVQCCTKKRHAEKFDRILVIWCSMLTKPNIAWSSWPRKTFFPHSIFHSARLCRLGVEWEGSVINTDFNLKQPSFL